MEDGLSRARQGHGLQSPCSEGDGLGTPCSQPGPSAHTRRGGWKERGGGRCVRLCYEELLDTSLHPSDPRFLLLNITPGTSPHPHKTAAPQPLETVSQRRWAQGFGGGGQRAATESGNAGKATASTKQAPALPHDVGNAVPRPAPQRARGAASRFHSDPTTMKTSS